MAAPTTKTKPGMEDRHLFRVTFHPHPSHRPTNAGEEAIPNDQNLIWDTTSPLGLGFPFRWAVERTDRGIRVRRLDGPRDEALGESVKEYSFDEIATQPRIALLGTSGHDWFSLHPVMEHSAEALPEKQVAQFHWPAPTPASAEDKYFGRMLAQVIIGSALLMSVLWMMPKPKPNTEELVPPQFAKLLLKPTVKKEATTKESKSIESTRERNVVRAFESKALQKTVKNVLNLGQISGLSKSALVGGLGAAGAAAKVFNSKAAANPFKGLDNSLLAGSGPKVDPLGGGKYKGTDVVAINGQGNHQLAFDPSAVEVAEGLDKDQVGKTIRGHVGEIRYCYEAALVKNPSLEGKLVVTFVIAANGAVKSATNKQTNADAGLVKCILDHLKKWSFPKPVGGMEVEVSYPFIFKSIGG